MHCQTWECIRGSTDTEHAFGLFLHGVGSLDKRLSTSEMRTLLVMTIATLVHIAQLQKNPLTLNFAVSDGYSTVVSRFAANAEQSPTLYYSSGQRYVLNGNDCDMIPSSNGHTGATLIASEPITRQPNEWTLVPQNHTVSVDPDGMCSVEKITI